MTPDSIRRRATHHTRQCALFCWESTVTRNEGVPTSCTSSFPKRCRHVGLSQKKQSFKRKKGKKNKELNRLLLQSVSCSLCHQSMWPPLFDGFFMVVWLSLWVLYTGSAVDLQPQHWKHTHRHQNIHYDTVERYNNYTEKEITVLKQHR